MPLETNDFYGYGSTETFTNSDETPITRNRYNISQFQYPDDLQNDDLKHWVQFNINVRGKSELKLGGETRLFDTKRSQDAPQLTENQLALNKTAALGLGGAAAGFGFGKIIGEARNIFSTRSGRTGNDITPSALKKFTAGGAIVGLAAGLTDLLSTDTSSRISDVIALYMDGPPTVRYNAGYSNKDLGTVAGMVAGAGSAVGSMSLGQMGSFGVEAGAATAALFAKVPQIAGVNTADVLGAAAKVALNPFKEVLFESIDFRTFAFKYKFFPKNRGETVAVEEIIRRFKFHMHPELSENKLFYIYPSEFQIAYYFGRDENTYFHKFKPCVLESMEVAYGGEQFSSFSDGKPTEINMSLQFRETEILTKQQIKQGY